MYFKRKIYVYNFHLELNSKPSKNKTYNILLRITQNKEHIRKKTTIAVKSKSDFNTKAKYGSWIRSSEPNHKKWNEILNGEAYLHTLVNEK